MLSTKEAVLIDLQPGRANAVSRLFLLKSLLTPHSMQATVHRLCCPKGLCQLLCPGLDPGSWSWKSFTACLHPQEVVVGFGTLHPLRSSSGWLLEGMGWRWPGAGRFTGGSRREQTGGRMGRELGRRGLSTPRCCRFTASRADLRVLVLRVM